MHFKLDTSWGGWALTSGIALTDDEAERAGRVIAGVITYEEAREEISARYRRSE